LFFFANQITSKKTKIQMGLTDFYPLIKSKAKKCIKETTLQELVKTIEENKESRYVASDADFFCYGLSIQHEKNVAKIVNGYKRNHLDKLISEGLQPIVVLGGKKSVPEKSTTNQKRTKQKMQDAEKKIKIENMKIEATKIISSGKRVIDDDDQDSKSIVPIDPFNVVTLSSFPYDSSSSINPSSSATAGKMSDEDVKKILIAGNYDPEIINKKGRTSKWMKDLIEKSSYDVKIESLKSRSYGLDSSMVDDIFTMLQKDGYICIRAESEADFVISHLFRDKIINYAFSDDADFFTFGATNLIRGFSQHSFDKSKPLTVYNLEIMLREFDFDKDPKKNMDKFIEMCILCKCDYVKNGIKGIGPVKAYNGIKDCGTVEKFVKKLKKSSKKPLEMDADFDQQVIQARELFHHPRNRDYLLNFGEQFHEIFSLEETRTILSHYLGTF
jgi:hypothetical protein